MSIDEKTYHLIDKFLHGDLKGSKLDKFRARIKNEPDLKEAVDSQRSIISAIEAHREEELRTFLKSELNKTRVIPLAGKWKVALSTAAAVILLAVVVLNLPQLSTNESNSTAQEPEQVEATEQVATQEDSKPNSDKESKALPETTPIDSQAIALEEVEPPILEVIEDDMEIVEETEMDLVEEKKPSEVILTGDSSVSIATSEIDKITDSIAGREPVILKDEMLFAQAYTVQLVSLDVLSDEVEKSRSDMANVPSSTKKLDLDEVQIESESEDKEEYKSKPISRQITVQFWKSVVNFKGYKYDGQTIQLFGYDRSQITTFKELDSRLYLQVGKKFYFIEKNNKHNRLVETTNSTLLNVLND